MLARNFAFVLSAVLLLSLANCSSQKSALQIREDRKPLSLERYSSGLFARYSNDAGLVDLSKSSYKKHYRFLDATFAVDVWQVDEKTSPEGMITLVAETTLVVFETKNQYSTEQSLGNKIFTKTIGLSPDMVKPMLFLLTELSKIRYPEQKDTTLQYGSFDGRYFEAGFRDGKNLSLVSSSAPWPEAFEMEQMAEKLAIRIEMSLETDSLFKEFIHTLPKGCYRAGGIFALCNREEEN